LKPHLRAENCTELLEMARGASRRELERRLAARFPQADSGEFLRAQKVKPLSAERFALQLSIGSETRARLERVLDLMSHANPSRSLEVVIDRALDGLVRELEHKRLAKTKRSGPRLAKTKRPRLAETERAAQRVKEISAPSNARAGAGDRAARSAESESTRAGAGDRSGTAAESESARAGAGDRAARSAESESTRAGAGDRSATSAESESARAGAGASGAKSENPVRAIPRAIRRLVFERDGAQCSFIGETGQRCCCRGALELDHITPLSRGGPSDPANLRVLCRAHNRLAAEEWFGRACVETAVTEARAMGAARAGDLRCHARSR